VIATLLEPLDGLVRRDRVLVVVVTNLVDLIDPALCPPGRFGMELRFGLPDAAGRAAVVRVSTAAKDVAMEDADAAWIAKHTDEWSEAELAIHGDDAATTVHAKRFPGMPDLFEKAVDNDANVRVYRKETLYRLQHFTRLRTTPPVRRPLPQRVARLLPTTLADVRRFLTHNFPVQRLRSMAWGCVAEALGAVRTLGSEAWPRNSPFCPSDCSLTGTRGCGRASSQLWFCMR